MNGRRLAGALAFSLLVHGTIAGGGYLEYAKGPRFTKHERAEPLRQIQNRTVEKPDPRLIETKEEERKVKFRKRREELVTNAREDLKNGRLRLGEFVLDANRLDAEQEGRPFDAVAVRKRYDGYLEKIKSYHEDGKEVHLVVSEALEDLAYYGVQGTMAELLATGGGNCEHLSHLVSSLIYDLGFKDAIKLRKYYDHLAPILVQNGREYDLTAGKYSDKRGVRMEASSLIEAYASGDGNGFAYPETEDRFKGLVPMFAKPAARKFDPSRKDYEVKQESIDYLAFNLLNAFPSGHPEEPNGNLYVTPLPMLSEDLLGRLCLRIELEKKNLQVKKTKAERLIHIGYLAGLLETAWFHLRAWGRYGPAEVAEKERKNLLAEADGMLDSLPDAKSLVDMRLERAWCTIFLGPKAETLLLKLMRDISFAEKNAYLLDRLDAEYKILAALAVKKSTRDEAMPLILSLPKTHQLRVARLLDSGSVLLNRKIDLEEYEEFYRAYTLYRNVRQRYGYIYTYYQGSKEMSFNKLLGLIREERASQKLGKDWETALIKYYGAHMFILWMTDKDIVSDYSRLGQIVALPFMNELRVWLAENSADGLEDLKTMVDYVVLKGRFDVDSVREVRRLAGL